MGPDKATLRRNDFRALDPNKANEAPCCEERLRVIQLNPQRDLHMHCRTSNSRRQHALMVKSTRAFLFPLPLGFVCIVNQLQHLAGFWSVPPAVLLVFHEHPQIRTAFPVVLLDAVDDTGTQNLFERFKHGRTLIASVLYDLVGEIARHTEEHKRIRMRRGNQASPLLAAAAARKNMRPVRSKPLIPILTDTCPPFVFLDTIDRAGFQNLLEDSPAPSPFPLIRT
jgi:hypothetical protein